MKWISRGLAIMLALFLVGCGVFSGPEEYREEGNRTVYRAPGGAEGEAVSTPKPQKVPGE
ncbi:MAG TPA: hypothetical protein VIV62_04790 [Chthoniobacterales bacterium]